MSIAKIKLPEDVIAIPMLRTTYIFKGLILSSGIIDAGFSGRLKMYIFNSSDNAVVPEKGELRRPIHLLFMETSGKSLMPYGRRHTEKNNSQ
jgi:deoxycytidine triphosphate deaminase